MTTILAPVETTPILLMKFTAEASPQLMDAIAERLIEGGLRIVVKEGDILGLSTDQAHLQAEAEHIRLVKRRNDTGIMEDFNMRDKKDYMNEEGFWKDAEGLFTANDRCILVWNLMDDICVLPANMGQQQQVVASSNLSRVLDQAGISYQDGPHKTAVLLGQVLQKRILYQDGPHKTAVLRQVLQKHNLAQIMPVHIPHISHSIFRQTMYSPTVPVQEIRDYYGEEIAFYFAWMDFLTKWLIFPGILGVITLLQRWYRGDNVDQDEYTPFYGLFCFLWAICYCRFWKRHEHRLAYSWGTYAQSEYERKGYFLRHQFRGTLRQSPITGAIETYYPPFQRRLKYIVSALITAILLGVAFCVMILSLNLQGYIDPKRDPERWGTRHPFHYPVLSVLAQEGQIFDAASSWRCLIPVALHVACIFSMNLIYRKIAERLTDWENHETQFGHKNSLILKRFLFEAFDCYVALFYLAFYKRDVDRLHSELISIFNIDTFRRLGLECILPLLFQRVVSPLCMLQRRTTTLCAQAILLF